VLCLACFCFAVLVLLLLLLLLAAVAGLRCFFPVTRKSIAAFMLIYGNG